MQPWEPKSYLKVLARLGREPDRFDRYLLDPEDVDEEKIRDRLGLVNAFWKNNAAKLPGPNKILVERFLREHRRCEAELLDSQARPALAEKARAERAAAEAARFAGIDYALGELHADFDGIPSDRLELVRGIGKTAGLAEHEVEDHIASVLRQRGWRMIETIARKTVQPLSGFDAKRIRERLSRYEGARRDENGDERSVRTLFDALDGQAFDATPGELEKAIETLAKAGKTEAKQGGTLKAAIGDVVAEARQQLITDEALLRYRATVINEVVEALKGNFMSFVAADDTLSPDEYDRLLRDAIEQGLSERAARSAIKALVESADRSIRVEVSSAVVGYITCVECHRPAPADGSESRCRGCGASLFRACPNCGQDSARAEPCCRSCGYSFAELERAARALSAGRRALNSKRPAQAADHAELALQLVPKDPEALALRSEAAQALTEAHRRWAAATSAESERRLYAARAALRALEAAASDVLAPHGDLPREALDRVTSQVEAIEVQLVQARATADPAIRERLFADVLARGADSAEAQRELERTPPRPPGGVRAELTPDGVRLRWTASPSPGVEEYVVVRGSGFVPATPQEGTRVRSAGPTSALDAEAPVGCQANYAIFAIRAGVPSTPVGSAPVLVALEVADALASVGAEEVRLSWRLPAPGVAVTVERRTPPNGAAVAIPTGPDGLVDRGVRNGVTYAYRIRLRYQGMSDATAGVEVRATPAAPPRAVALSAITPVAGGVELQWTDPPRGTVVVCRSSAALDVESGTELARGELISFGDLLPGDRGRAMDGAPVDGAFYTPFTVDGDRAVAGAGLCWEDMPPITDVRAEDAGEGVRITWAWPNEIHHALLVWRSGARPDGPEDPDAERHRVRRDQHQEVHGGGFRIMPMSDAPLYVDAYAARMRDGELRVGPRLAPSSRARITPAVGRQTVRYDVRVKRGIKGRSLLVRLEGVPPHPEVVLIARPEIVPLRRTDGQPVVQLGGSDRPSEIDIPVSRLPSDRPLCLRAFLVADGSEGGWSIKEPEDLTSLVLR